MYNVIEDKLNEKNTKIRKGVVTMKAMHKIAFILLIIGGLNWLIVALAGKDLFQLLNMSMNSTLPRIVYLLVGLATLWEIFTHGKHCKACTMPAAAKPTM